MRESLRLQSTTNKYEWAQNKKMKVLENQGSIFENLIVLEALAKFEKRRLLRFARNDKPCRKGHCEE